MTFSRMPGLATPWWMSWPVFGIALLIHFLALYLPGSPEPSSFDIPGSDKVLHVLLFAAPACLMVGRFSSTWPVWLLAVHAPVSEVIQWQWIPYRSGDLLDLVADLAGVALGWWLATRAQSGHGRAT